MRYIHTILLSLTAIVLLFSCAKYKSGTGKVDPNDTAHYCNDPAAVNYNWNFPGIADSAVCFYPTDVFAGVYLFHDSMFLASTGYFIHADTFILTMSKIGTSKTHFQIVGLCLNGTPITMTAWPGYIATIDTAVGDSVTDISGQLLCGSTSADTITGSMTKNPLSDSFITVTFTVSADSGVFTQHTGTAYLLHK